ncbi:hypothetical protein SDC9_206625 [bioreactor metagenome]|uniref:Uncharacterized protein n=1 Tax=bioreactor metagenome TaxID=1076179 RepID=A0A645J886_9ZZZZ
MSEVGKKHGRVAVEQLQDEAEAPFSGEAPYPFFGKIGDDRGFLGGDGNDDIINQHDADRQRAVDVSAAFFFHKGGIHDDEGLVVIMLKARPFLNVQSG